MIKEDNLVLEYFKEKNIYDSPDIYDSPSVSTVCDTNFENELKADDIYGSPHISQNYDELYSDSFIDTATKISTKSMIDLTNDEDRILLTSALNSMQQSIASMQIKIKDIEYGESSEYPHSISKRNLQTPTKDKRYDENELYSEENLINICISGQTFMHSNSISICISPNPAIDEIVKVNPTSVSVIGDAYSAETVVPTTNLNNVKIKKQKNNMMKYLIMTLILILFAIYLKTSTMSEIFQIDLLDRGKVSEQFSTVIGMRTNLTDSDYPKKALLLLTKDLLTHHHHHHDDNRIFPTIFINESFTDIQLSNKSINTHNNAQSIHTYKNKHNDTPLTNSYPNEMIHLNTTHTPLPNISKSFRRISILRLTINLCSKVMNRIKYIIKILLSGKP